MKTLRQHRKRLRRELEAPAALRAFGSGWISGTLSISLGVAALLTVIACRFPGLLATKELLGTIPVAALRISLVLVILSSFLLAVLSLLLRKNAYLGTMGIILSLLASRHRKRSD